MQGQKAEQLRDGITNIVQHYKGQQPHQVPCQFPLLLRSQLHSNQDPDSLPHSWKSPPGFSAQTSNIQEAALYANCKDTQYAEWYNNILLQYHDKRTAFGKTCWDRAVHPWLECKCGLSHHLQTSGRYSSSLQDCLFMWRKRTTSNWRCVAQNSHCLHLTSHSYWLA